MLVGDCLVMMLTPARFYVTLPFSSRELAHSVFHFSHFSFHRERFFLFRFSQDLCCLTCLGWPIISWPNQLCSELQLWPRGPTFSARLWVRENCLSQGSGSSGSNSHLHWDHSDWMSFIIRSVTKETSHRMSPELILTTKNTTYTFNNQLFFFFFYLKNTSVSLITCQELSQKFYKY